MMKLPSRVKFSHAPRRVRGQAMIEYIVVLAFSVILLTRGSPSAITQLSTAIKDYHRSYTVALDIAAIPECTRNFNLTVNNSSLPSGMNLPGFNLSGSGSIDLCIDMTNPSIPTITNVNGNFSLGNNLPTGNVLNTIVSTAGTSFKTAIKKQVTDALNPKNLLKSLLDNFKPANLLKMLSPF